MPIEQERIDALVASPIESLSVELKRWLDLSLNEHRAKIVKGCLALRNFGGGFIVVGFDDDGSPDVSNAPPNPREQFHVDVVQGLISKYASEVFEIEVAFSQRDGVSYPVIVVPSGVRTPVASKASLQNEGKSFIAKGQVFFRTLITNGTPSSSVAGPDDWAAITDICFENREADIGRFLRRHLSGVDVTALVEALSQWRPPVPTPSLAESAHDLLGLGSDRFEDAAKQRKTNPLLRSMYSLLTWEVALVVEPSFVNYGHDQAFLQKIARANPDYTGWPIWLDARGLSEVENRPYVSGRAWEALVISEGFSRHMDFMRFDPLGRFYLRRTLQDDLTVSKVEPRTSLDPLLVVIRVAEAIIVGLKMVVALTEGNSSPKTLGFGFRWTHLRGRVLSSWANPMMVTLGHHEAKDEEVETFVEVPGDTPVSAVAPYVSAATRDLFLAFEGQSIPIGVVEDFCARLVERRLP